ncbi:serine/threonine protein kinase [Pendulispora rubella]|uniref:Serine/threonine protein kinase n=1 Tax=Pendulispora rubella TaxID=2741070 RepID=A0ABZ2LM56_9BACT
MFLAGDTFHRYRIEEKIGEGGLGFVYRAYDPILHREIALKIVRPEVARTPSGQLSEAALRLMREGRAVASLNHRNAVGIFDVGEIDGTPYIAMELAPGKLLSTYVGDDDVPIRLRIGWLAQIACGLDAAHKEGLVHRDVKPENVMVCDNGEVKLFDFGVVKRVTAPVLDDSEPNSEPVATRVGAVMGTPLYMAPEQALGEAVDGRSDQFAWATLAYELLSGGVHPILGKNPRGVPIVISWFQPGAGPKRLADVALELPAGVSDIVMKALSKLPADRFASMGEIVAALEAIGKAMDAAEQAGDAEIAAAPTMWQPMPIMDAMSGGTSRPRLLSRKAKAWAWALAGVLVVSVAVLGYRFGPWGRRHVAQHH